MRLLLRAVLVPYINAPKQPGPRQPERRGVYSLQFELGKSATCVLYNAIRWTSVACLYTRLGLATSIDHSAVHFPRHTIPDRRCTYTKISQYRVTH